tara:strand:- start:613 stop:927 length:315 start_codon:yes stop_codon:yes gene_type:complete
MKDFENVFKERKEIYTYFGEEVFGFSFMSDNIMTFKSLNPKFINEELFDFELSFYYESGKDFFAYSSLDTWLDSFQLSSLICESQETRERTEMFFRKYKDPSLK